MAQRTEDAPWLAQGEEKREAVRDLFADIAPKYDRMNALLSLGMHNRWRSRAVATLNLQPGDKALDVCCGTGDFLLPLSKAVGEDGEAEGLDFCQPMLDVARTKLPDRVRLTLGDATSLPYEDAAFDAVTVGWGLRNVPDIPAALREAARVLKPGGRFASLDMAIPRNPLLRSSSRVFTDKVGPALGRALGSRTAYEYLPKSVHSFMSREQLAEAMRQAGFVDVAWHDFMMGNICLHHARIP